MVSRYLAFLSCLLNSLNCALKGDVGLQPHKSRGSLQQATSMSHGHFGFPLFSIQKILKCN